MISGSALKNTLLILALFMLACGNAVKKPANAGSKATSATPPKFKTGAENYMEYIHTFKNKNVGVVTNQTGIVSYDSIYMLPDEGGRTHQEAYKTKKLHLVDFLIEMKVPVKKIFAPEHGFRGNADAGELVADGKDTKTGLPIISLYGDNKKPKAESLKGIDVMVFDLQDVGARFYTYISTLHYIMEACAENKIALIVLDRPNPNGNIVDGPILEKEHVSFVGMHEIPVLHGMTIGEYALMINGEKWLKGDVKCDLTVIPCLNYNRDMPYSLPVKPSPNLPNDQAINLYASLCFFEGTNVSVGRGTSKQFQVYGSPLLPDSGYSFTPMPNEGAKEPPLKGIKCFGEDLSKSPKVSRLELKWLLKAYRETKDQSKFFNAFFTKLAGTKSLRQQIEQGMTETQIRASWSDGLKKFRARRAPYLLYPDKK